MSIIKIQTLYEVMFTDYPDIVNVAQVQAMPAGQAIWRDWQAGLDAPARAALEQVDKHLEDAARTLGASEWRVFVSVSLPLAWKGIFAGIMLAFARGMGEFGATLMIAGNIPGKTQTLALAIYDAFQAGNDLQASWLVVITSAVCVSLLMAAELLVRLKRRR